MSINDNSNGIQINAPAGGSIANNNGHGTISSCTINHNSAYNVQVNDDSLGMVFSGCQLFDSYIHVKNSIGIIFVGCEVAPIAFYFENATGTRFSDCVFYTGYGFTVNNNYNSTTSETIWNNNQYLGGAASGSYIGINSVAAANSTLQVAGSFSAAYVAKTANYTATISDYTIECTANTFQVTLPTAVGITGRIYNIVNSGAGTITIGTTSSQTFVNVTATPTTLTLATVGAIAVQSNGANWMKLD
jgi:hypothetical protein